MVERLGNRLGNRASNLKVASSIPGCAKWRPWARHFTLLALGECPCTYCKSLWIRASAKWLNVIVNVWLWFPHTPLCSTPALTYTTFIPLFNSGIQDHPSLTEPLWKISPPAYSLRLSQCPKPTKINIRQRFLHLIQSKYCEPGASCSMINTFADGTKWNMEVCHSFLLVPPHEKLHLCT